MRSALCILVFVTDSDIEKPFGRNKNAQNWTLYFCVDIEPDGRYIIARLLRLKCNL